MGECNRVDGLQGQVQVTPDPHGCRASEQDQERHDWQELGGVSGEGSSGFYCMGA